jgi:hypothetical protein
MPFTVYDGLVKALQFDSFGTLGIEVILFTLVPLCLATVLTVQTAIIAVVAKPVVGYSSAGYPIHHCFGEGLVSVVTLYIGKGHYYRVEYVLFVLRLNPVGKA